MKNYNDQPASILSKSNYQKPTVFKTSDKMERHLKINQIDLFSGRYKYQLYRFLADSIPVVNACLNTWTRLSAAPGEYLIHAGSESQREKAAEALGQLQKNLTGDNSGSMMSLLVRFFNGLFRDGLNGGFLTIKKDQSSVDRFIFIDVADIKIKNNRKILELDNQELNLETDDFYLLRYNADYSNPLGKSIFQPIPFIAYIEQQLIDDMRRSSHNSGYHRLHVKITPPERISGESENAYVDRVNSYFDSTVAMIKACDVDDNPVTWDNIAIESIGPQNVRTLTNSWSLNLKAMIEELCAGTNLAPFLLGYSYGATTTWSSFKYDLVMRQVQSVQQEVAAWLNWIGTIELALKGIDAECDYRFDNSLTYQKLEQSQIRSNDLSNLLKLYEAGLIDQKEAQIAAGRLL